MGGTVLNYEANTIYLEGFWSGLLDALRELMRDNPSDKLFEKYNRYVEAAVIQLYQCEEKADAIAKALDLNEGVVDLIIKEEKERNEVRAILRNSPRYI